MARTPPGCDIPVDLLETPMSAESIRILLVEDSRTAAQLVELYLGDSLNVDYELHRVATLAEGVESLGREPFQIVLLDLNLPDSQGLNTFGRLRRQFPQASIIVLSGVSDESVALQAVREGAQDYLFKDNLDEAQLCRAILFAIERSQRMEMERALSAAEAVQASLYPESGPQVPGFDIGGRCYPADRCSGDYFDFIPMRDDHVGVVVADVSGHGLGPALKMAETRAYLHALTHAWDEIRAMVKEASRIDDILSRTNQLLTDSPGMFVVSLFFLQLAPRQSVLRYAGAGHRAFLLRGDGDVDTLDSTNPILGLTRDSFGSGSREIAMVPGDTVLIPTDGFEETIGPDGDLFGKRRVIAAVREHEHQSAGDIIAALYREAQDFDGRTQQRDDMTAVVVKALH